MVIDHVKLCINRATPPVIVFAYQCPAAQSPKRFKDQINHLFHPLPNACPFHTTMSDSFWDSENRLDEAISAYNSGDYSSASAVARKFHVDSRTLRRRLNGGAFKSTRSSSKKHLQMHKTKLVVHILSDWII